METSSGKWSIFFFVPKGTAVTIPFVHMHRNEAFWGPDAKQFVPERWLQENPYSSQDFSGYRHLHTFSDGRTDVCSGGIQAVLSVLLRNFTFGLPSGPDTPIVTHRILMPRPKLVDEAGCILRMRVRQVTGLGEES
ncbi:hypothetical protein M378DRAFT_566037 [Amanita muscaria Koide BX008]|uniref:Uncharacterized protein n=1 Tax=Amanita muscaria (strain Koide BX008) TaxID=946122 RepID=A0A0C2TDG7_AMAMK|nr:hypothetical protein M378DRAFT_566037 [Amanita muscaria Koide BX008]